MKSVLTLFALLSVFTLTAQNADSTAAAQHKLILQADSLMIDYQFKQALSLLVKCDSLNAEILLRVGQCNFRLGTSRSAIRVYERVLRMDSANRTALNQLGQLYTHDGDLVNALSSYLRLIKLDSANSYYYRQAGSVAARLDNKIIAKFWYKKGLYLNPADAEASLALGTILMDLEEFEEVDSLVESALTQDPEYKPMLLLKAKSAFEQHRYPLVVATVNKLLEKEDTTATYARLLGASYFQLHEYKKVITCMNFMLRNKYDNDWIYYYLGVASRELGDVRASISYFRTAVQKSISKNTATYFSQLGKSYEEMKDYAAAISAYHSAYNNSKEGILLYQLARNYDAYYKDKAQALAYYKKYVESDDTIRRAKEYARLRIQAISR